MRLDRRKRLREKGISPDASEICERHRAIGGPVAAHREQQAEALRSHHEPDRSPQASPRVAVALETPHRLDGRGIEKRNHRAREHRGEHQHDAHLRRRARERQSTDGEQHAGGAHRERTRRRAEPVRDSTPDQRRRSRHGLLRERDRADLLAREPQPAQVRCEVGKEGSDARVMKEVEPAQPPDHPGASSGSIVHSSGNAAFSASARVSCTLVSAISKV